MQIEEILIVKNGSESFGISTQDINQIFRVPVITPLPIRPAQVRGLSVVGGHISNIMDLNMLLDMGCVDINNDKSRLLSLMGNNSMNALLVSEVYNTVNINSSNIKYIERDDDSVIAIYKYEEMIIQIISLVSLFQKIKKVEIQAKLINEGKVQEPVEMEEPSRRFLIFNMLKEYFAIDIEFLREIILADVKFTEFIGSKEEILGLITLRDELITIIDLRTYYGFNGSRNDKNRILIVSLNDSTVGFLVDEIIDIKSFINKNIEYMNDESNKSRISGVLHDNKSLISFIDDNVLSQIIEENESYIDKKENNEIEELSEDDLLECIVFKLNNREYAFEVEKVAEIIDLIESTNIVYSQKKIDGVINIRGQIVPIVSLCKILNIEESTIKDPKIIVINFNENKVGFVVDSISDILKIEKKDIKNQDDEFLTDVLHLDGGERLVLMIDVEHMINFKEN